MEEKWGWIYTTTSSMEEAKKIARFLVKKKLAACANIIDGLCSFYEDQGKVESHDETALILKTRKSLFKDIEREMKHLHSYQCPCLVFIPFESAVTPFLKWMNEKMTTPSP